MAKKIKLASISVISVSTGKRTAGSLIYLINFFHSFIEYYDSGVAAYVHLNYRNSTISVWQEERA